MGMMPLLLRYGLPAAAGAALVAGIWFHGHAAGKDSVQVKWDADKAERIAAQIATEKRHRAREAELHANVQTISDQLSAAQRASLQELDTTLVDLRSDNLRLRERFRTCRVSGTPETASGDDGAGDTGLSEADQEFLLRIGADADRVVNKLTACQGYVMGVQDGQ
tara:strand:+ start:42498 stop:42992 length:495 start_codon:yes stop_codon:yes gene_type:complete